MYRMLRFGLRTGPLSLRLLELCSLWALTLSDGSSKPKNSSSSGLPMSSKICTLLSCWSNEFILARLGFNLPRDGDPSMPHVVSSRRRERTMSPDSSGDSDSSEDMLMWCGMERVLRICAPWRDRRCISVLPVAMWVPSNIDSFSSSASESVTDESFLCSDVMS